MSRPRETHETLSADSFQRIERSKDTAQGRQDLLTFLSPLVTVCEAVLRRLKDGHPRISAAPSQYKATRCDATSQRQLSPNRPHVEHPR